MLNNKFIILAKNVYDDENSILPDFYLGERHIDMSVLSHDIFDFDTIEEAERHANRDNFISNFRDAVFVIQKVELQNIKEI